MDPGCLILQALRFACILNELFDSISDNEPCIFENKTRAHESYLSNSNWRDFPIYRFIIKRFIKDQKPDITIQPQRKWFQSVRLGGVNTAKRLSSFEEG